MYGRVPEPWWLRSAAPIVTQTNQIYVYMQIVRGRLVEIYVYIALQASRFLGCLERATCVVHSIYPRLARKVLNACTPSPHIMWFPLARFPLTRIFAYVRASGGIPIYLNHKYSPTNAIFA